MNLKSFFAPIADTIGSVLLINGATSIGKTVDHEHEQLMKEQYEMTHPKCEKETPSK